MGWGAEKDESTALLQKDEDQFTPLEKRNMAFYIAGRGGKKNKEGRWKEWVGQKEGGERREEAESVREEWEEEERGRGGKRGE